jgi:hypothetical protein
MVYGCARCPGNVGDDDSVFDQAYGFEAQRPLNIPDKVGMGIGLGLCALLLTAPVQDLREWDASRNAQEQERILTQQQGELA